MKILLVVLLLLPLLVLAQMRVNTYKQHGLPGMSTSGTTSTINGNFDPAYFDPTYFDTGS